VDLVGVLELAAKRRREVRRADVVEGEDLLREGLVLREVERLRAGARVGPSEKVEVRRDVHVLRVVAGVRLGHVEEELGTALDDRGERRVAPVEHVVARFVLQLE
jgi:hypothetical protein